MIIRNVGLHGLGECVSNKSPTDAEFVRARELIAQLAPPGVVDRYQMTKVMLEAVDRARTEFGREGCSSGSILGKLNNYVVQFIEERARQGGQFENRRELLRPTRYKNAAPPPIAPPAPNPPPTTPPPVVTTPSPPVSAGPTPPPPPPPQQQQPQIVYVQPPATVAPPAPEPDAEPAGPLDQLKAQLSAVPLWAWGAAGVGALYFFNRKGKRR